MNAPTETLRAPVGPLQRLARGYDEGGRVNLPGYAASLAAFAGSALAVAAATRRSSRNIPAITAQDVVLGGVAAHTVSRVLAKGAVTSPLRAPFTEFEEPAGASQHQEHPRGSRGIRHTLGELLSCPFCLSQWTAGAYVTGLLLAPRATRRWAAMFAVAGLSDALHHGYERLHD